MNRKALPGEFRKVVGLYLWGDVWEDYHGTLGISFQEFCTNYTGSWVFGLVRALQEIDVSAVMYFSTNTVKEVKRARHQPSGANICMIPAPRIYRTIYNKMIHPHHTMGIGAPIEELFGEVGRGKRFYRYLRQISPYLATSLGALRQEIRRDGCCAVICQEYEVPHFDQVALMGKFMRLPVYATFQGCGGDWTRMGRMLRPFTMQFGSGFLIGPEAEVERVKGRYHVPDEKIHRVLNAVDDEMFSTSDKSRCRVNLGIAPGQIVVMWHGRVQTYAKGLDVLLDAWEMVAETRRDSVVLMLMGDGSDRAYLEARISELRPLKVVWIDKFVHDKRQIRDFLSAGDIYAFSSRSEGLPVAPTEAMARGLPVVAADASGVRDIFPDGEQSGGIVVPIGDPKAFAQGLERLIDDADLRRDLGQRAGEAAHRFTAKSVGRQLAAVLQAGKCR